MPYTITRRRRRLHGMGQTSVTLFDQIMAYAQTLPAFGGAHGDVMNIGQFCPIYKAVTGMDCPTLTSLAVFGINQTSAYPTTFLIQAVQSAGASGAPAPVPALFPAPSVSIPQPGSAPPPAPAPSISPLPPVPVPVDAGTVPSSTYTVASGEAPTPTPSSAPGLLAPVTGYLQTAKSAATTSFSLPVWALALGAVALFLFGRRGR